MLFDAHLHFSDEFKEIPKTETIEIIKLAKENKIDYFVSNSVNLKTIDETIRLVKTTKSVLGGIGIFPTEFKTDKDLKQLNKIRETIKKLKKQNLLNRFVIGEVGLDFKDLHNSSLEKKKQEIQEKAFKKQIEIAKENNLFLEVHSRFSVKQTVEILEQMQYPNIIMHWFTDSKKYVDRVAKLGYLITVGPKYLYDQNIFENIKDVPKEQILFETDYPAQVSGKAHEPSEILLIFKKYCKDFEIDEKEMLKCQKRNFQRIFKGVL